MGELVPDPCPSRLDGTARMFAEFDDQRHAAVLDAEFMRCADHAVAAASELPVKLACWLADGGTTAVTFVPPGA